MQENIILILFLIEISLFLLKGSFISVGLQKRMDLIINFFSVFHVSVLGLTAFWGHCFLASALCTTGFCFLVEILEK